MADALGPAVVGEQGANAVDTLGTKLRSRPYRGGRGVRPAHGIDWVQTATADARDAGLPSGTFDLVFCRTLLINVPRPGEVLARRSA
jgi:hypothetical protein